MANIITKNVRDICTKSLKAIGVIAADETPDAADMEDAAQWLNIWLKSSQADGLELFLKERVDVPTVASTATYDLPTLTSPITGVIEVDHAVIVETGQTYEQPIELLSRDEYFDLPNKDDEGNPTHLFPEFTDTTQKVTLWPTPNAVYTLKIDVRKEYTDLTTLDDVLQCPDHWQAAMIYGLAQHLLSDYGLSGTVEAQRIDAIANDEYNTAAAFEISRDGDGEIRFVPETRFYGDY